MNNNRASILAEIKYLESVCGAMQYLSERHTFVSSESMDIRRAYDNARSRIEALIGELSRSINQVERVQ